MKRLALFLIVLSISLNMLLAETEERIVDQVSVEFTVDRTHNVGFSSIDIGTSTIEPADEFKLTGSTIEFDKVSDDFRSYTTGPFYFYLQLFTTDKVRAVITAHPALNSTLHYTNSGYSGFTGSAMSGEAVLVAESEIADVNTDIPRPYCRMLELNVPVSSVEPNTDYTSYITVTISVDGEGNA